MVAAREAVLDHPGDIAQASDFVWERIRGAHACLIDLQRLRSYGHSRLCRHMQQIRDLLSGLGKAGSTYVTTLMLQRVRATQGSRNVDVQFLLDRDDLQPVIKAL